LSKELIRQQMVERQGLSSKIESFCRGASCGYFCLIARVVRSMRGLFDDKEICSKWVAREKFS